MYDLQSFGLREMIDAGRRLRRVEESRGCPAESMESAAVAVVDFLFESLGYRDRIGQLVPACVLARCFKTHLYGDLPIGSRGAWEGLTSPELPNPETPCLALLASRGELAAWNGRQGSVDHQAISLATVEAVARLPMVRQLILQLGLTVEEVVSLRRERREVQRPFGVFHVEEALGSAMVPAQEEFVKPFGVRSVLGFGGMLPAGDLFAVMLFTRVRVAPETANLFRTLALGVKLSLLPFSGKRVFAESRTPES